MAEKEMDFRIKLLNGGTLDLIRIMRPFVDRIEKLEAELSEAKNLKYMGTWNSAGIYNKGNLATHSGSLWIAETTTDKKPGTAESGWKLAAKGK